MSDQSETVRQLIAVMKAIHTRPDRDQSLRGQHMKAHGTVKASFTVGILPDRYCKGVFVSPKTYSAWIRFSSGKIMDDDRKPDAHGMAVKLLADNGVDDVQDFVLADNPVFFAKDAADLLSFIMLSKKHAELEKAAREEAPPDELAKIQKQNLVELITAFPLLKQFLKVSASPLTSDYHSQVPYKFDELIVKYFARPIDAASEQVQPAANMLKVAMKQVLEENKQDAVFEFGIEVQTDPSVMLVDDATQQWNSTEQVVLARITIPAQEFSNEEREAFGESLSFSPWHALSVHEPLGSLNAVRKEVYSHSFELRHRIRSAAQ